MSLFVPLWQPSQNVVTMVGIETSILFAKVVKQMHAQLLCTTLMGNELPVKLQKLSLLPVVFSPNFHAGGLLVLGMSHLLYALQECWLST